MARVFLALQAQEEYAQELPTGRDIAPTMRHMTLVFFPDADLERLVEALHALSNLPKVGFGGVADSLLLLPPRHPHVLAWNVNLGPFYPFADTWQHTLTFWALASGFLPKNEMRPFLPHVSLSRSPFHHLERMKTVIPVPICFSSLHLYDSVGNLQYMKRWSKELIPPYLEIEHTADIAYKISGTSLSELFWNASLALATRCPRILPIEIPPLNGHEDIIMHLNRRISEIDAAEGIPLKAVSYHGNLYQEEAITYWEMIVDV